MPWLVSYAVGALLGVALLALLPEALAELSPQAVFGTLLAGILIFFVLEKLVLLRHCHTDECQVHGATAPLVFIGDAFHNFLDGAIICAAVLTSVPLGINTAIAVAAHEIPQEVGDVAILLAAGYSRGQRAAAEHRVRRVGHRSARSSRSPRSKSCPDIRPYVLAISSASLLYIAMSDLIPDLHRGTIDASAIRQVVLIAAGIGTIVVFEQADGMTWPSTRPIWPPSKRCGAARSKRPAPTGISPNRERDPKRKDILLRLADQEEKHAARWSERIATATGRAPDRKEVERGLSWFQRISDPNVVLHRLEQEENKAEAEYDQLMARLSDPADRQIAEEAMLEERDHAVILRTLAGGAMPTPRSTLDSILGRERWHVRGTGWIGDAIYGVNDGLGAVFGIVSGMAGYTGGSEVVLAAGLAGTLASALSMGAGAYLASKSQREVYESEVAREQAEIEEDPHEETARARAVLPAQGVLGRRGARDGRAAAEGAEAVPAHARPRGARALEENVPNPLALDDCRPTSRPRSAGSSRSSRSSSPSACRR